ncbi:MAG: MgtC/SapB family protein [Caldilineaceae bacterium]
MAIYLPQLQILGSVLLAMLLGGAIGYEREKADRPAGLRTHILVAGIAAFLINIGDLITLSANVDRSLIQIDPVRMIEAIITGISFLGAGTILRRKEGGDIEGLTTAASLLYVAGIGIAVGIHQFVLAIGITLLGLIVLYMKSVTHRTAS